MKKVMMLCLAVCIVGLQVFQSQADTLPQGLNYMNVQQRNVESGNTYNRLYFSMYDQNQTPAGNVLASATLYDPNGDIVSIPFPTYDPVNLLMGGYDVNSGQWNFSSGFDYFDNGYTASFDGNLIPGDYRLQVTTINGSTDEQTFKVSAPVECPIISSSSFHVWIDQSDNLVWEWDQPSINPDLNTSISAYMTAEGDDGNFFWISVPTDMNRITIPKTTFDLLKARGNNIMMGLNLRINDEFGNNYQRNISNPYFLSLTSSPTKTTAVLSVNEPDYTVTTGSDTMLYGTSLPNQIILESGAMAELINFPGQNSIQIQSSSDLFTVSRSGTVVTFQGPDGTILKIPATTSVQTVDFSDRMPMILSIHGGQVMLDDQVVTIAPSSIDFTLEYPINLFGVGSFWKYQVSTSTSTIEANGTVIGETNIFGVDGVAVIEISVGSEIQIDYKKMIDGSVFTYNYNGQTSAIEDVYYHFRSGPVGTGWSVIENTGIEQYEIVAIEDVQVPAGVFSKCYKVANSKINPSDGSLMSYDERWWHPGTGYVKIIEHIGLADQQQMVLIDYTISQ